jgi:ABC-2 type transport system ATP-binding protein
MIELTNVSKMFGKRLAVDDLTLRVAPGEIYGLLGHNGAGKSTAIGMMLGQVWATSGEIRICGKSVLSDRRNALQRVGAIFESPCFYDYLSGWRNLEILSSYTAPTSRARIDEVIEWVGLKGRESSRVRTYSHGMRARLALAQTLLPQPELLILDEPSDGLDPEGIHEIRQTILRLHRELHVTILLSSHFLNEVEQLCTSIAVLNQGRKIFEGSLADTRHRESWVRLKVDNFRAAVDLLTRTGLINAHRDGHLISLDENVATDQVVRVLVQANIAVYEIAQAEETLEEFYLSLMESERRGDGQGKPSVVAPRAGPA